jgi:photosystem II stability/assembly factor-like uncharacterized protein
MAARTGTCLLSTEKTGIPARIGAIAIDPFDTKHIRIGGVGFAETGGGADDLGGMYFTHDAGITWQRETFVLPTNYWCHSIVFDPKTRGTIYATFTARGPRSGIYKSTDGGKNWTQLKGGLPPASSIGRTSLALSPSNTNVLYAFAADEMSASSDQMLGVFRTSNGGKTWTNVAGTHFKKEGQISYGNTIAVHPKEFQPRHLRRRRFAPLDRRRQALDESHEMGRRARHESEVCPCRSPLPVDAGGQAGPRL